MSVLFDNPSEPHSGTLFFYFEVHGRIFFSWFSIIDDDIESSIKKSSAHFKVSDFHCAIIDGFVKWMIPTAESRVNGRTIIAFGPLCCL